jgi:hypothetical protein
MFGKAHPGGDRDPIPISALQHWCYCPRQCGLIHLEQAFEENVHTLRGQAVHSAVNAPGFETRAGVRTERALPLFHDRIGRCATAAPTPSLRLRLGVGATRIDQRALRSYHSRITIRTGSRS